MRNRLCILLITGGIGAAKAQEPADLVIQHAQVHTVDANQPLAQAFAIREGRFVAVGKDAEIASWIGPGTQVLDFAGKTVVPGFIDSHCHPGAVYPETSRWAAVDCRPGNVKDLAALIAAVICRRETGFWVHAIRT